MIIIIFFNCLVSITNGEDHGHTQISARRRSHLPFIPNSQLNHPHLKPSDKDKGLLMYRDQQNSVVNLQLQSKDFHASLGMKSPIKIIKNKFTLFSFESIPKEQVRASKTFSKLSVLPPIKKLDLAQKVNCTSEVECWNHIDKEREISMQNDGAAVSNLNREELISCHASNLFTPNSANSMSVSTNTEVNTLSCYSDITKMEEIEEFHSKAEDDYTWSMLSGKKLYPESLTRPSHIISNQSCHPSTVVSGAPEKQKMVKKVELMKEWIDTVESIPIPEMHITDFDDHFREVSKKHDLHGKSYEPNDSIGETDKGADNIDVMDSFDRSELFLQHDRHQPKHQLTSSVKTCQHSNRLVVSDLQELTLSNSPTEELKQTSINIGGALTLHGLNRKLVQEQNNEGGTHLLCKYQPKTGRVSHVCIGDEQIRPHAYESNFTRNERFQSEFILNTKNSVGPAPCGTIQNESSKATLVKTQKGILYNHQNNGSMNTAVSKVDNTNMTQKATVSFKECSSDEVKAAVKVSVLNISSPLKNSSFGCNSMNGATKIPHNASGDQNDDHFMADVNLYTESMSQVLAEKGNSQCGSSHNQNTTENWYSPVLVDTGVKSNSGSVSVKSNEGGNDNDRHLCNTARHQLQAVSDTSVDEKICNTLRLDKACALSKVEVQFKETETNLVPSNSRIKNFQKGPQWSSSGKINTVTQNIINIQFPEEMQGETTGYKLMADRSHVSKLQDNFENIQTSKGTMYQFLPPLPKFSDETLSQSSSFHLPIVENELNNLELNPSFPLGRVSVDPVYDDLPNQKMMDERHHEDQKDENGFMQTDTQLSYIQDENTMQLDEKSTSSSFDSQKNETDIRGDVVDSVCENVRPVCQQDQTAANSVPMIPKKRNGNSLAEGTMKDHSSFSHESTVKRDDDMEDNRSTFQFFAKNEHTRTNTYVRKQHNLKKEPAKQMKFLYPVKKKDDVTQKIKGYSTWILDGETPTYNRTIITTAQAAPKCVSTTNSVSYIEKNTRYMELKSKSNSMKDKNISCGSMLLSEDHKAGGDIEKILMKLLMSGNELSPGRYL